MKKKPDKRIATVLALLILVLPGALSGRERRGANLVITLKDGHYAAGELIAVKPDSLLLLAGKDESVDLVGIRSIRIVRKPKALLGAACGTLAGVLGTAIVASSNKEPDILEPYLITGTAVAFICGGLGVGIGAGLLAGKDKTIQFEGKSEPEVKRTLAYLRGKARIRD